jgi:hypothetical protein
MQHAVAHNVLQNASSDLSCRCRSLPWTGKVFAQQLVYVLIAGAQLFAAGLGPMVFLRCVVTCHCLDWAHDRKYVLLLNNSQCINQYCRSQTCRCTRPDVLCAALCS